MSHGVLLRHCDSSSPIAAVTRGCEMPETVVHFQVRMPPTLHEHLASRAREEKTSLNALVVAILRDAMVSHQEELAAPTPGAMPPV